MKFEKKTSNILNVVFCFLIIALLIGTIFNLTRVDVQAISRHPTGTMIYYDDMESLRMRLVNVQGTGEINLTNQWDYASTALYDNKYAVYIRTGNSSDDESYGFRALPLTVDRRFGVEFYLTTPFRYVNWNETRHKAFIFKIHVWDGTYVRLFGIKWLAETGQLQYWDSTGAWQNIAGSDAIRIRWAEPASNIKLIVDAGDSVSYRTLFLDEKTFYLSAIDGQQQASSNPPAIDLQFHAISTGVSVGYDEILIADLIVTNNEP